MTDHMQAATEAVVEAGVEHECLSCLSSLTLRGVVPDMLTAALPHLRALIRAEVGDEIAAEYDRKAKGLTHRDAAHMGAYAEGYTDALDAAEQIARGEADR